jgi:hypothetical protein
VSDETPDGNEPVTGTELARAFDAVYRRMGALTRRLERTSTYTHALLELLVDGGSLDKGELGEMVNAIRPMVAKELDDDGANVAINVQHEDKYAIEGPPDGPVDCDRRIHLCHGACCRMSFPLSQQDVEEGVVRWDLRHPYMAKKQPDGSCVHQEADSKGCEVYEHRPSVCRVYSCRHDDRIWLSFEDYVPNPELLLLSDPGLGARAAMTTVVLSPTRRKGS